MIVVAVTVSACGGNGRSHLGQVTVTVTSPTARLTRPARAALRHFAFSLPSRNIICDMSRVVTCRVLSAGQGVFILSTRGTAREASASASVTTPTHVLWYGSRHFQGPFVCQSSTAGVFCRTREQTRGLFLSRERQLLDVPPPARVARPAQTLPPNTGKQLASDKDFVVQELDVKDDGLGDIGGIARITNTATKPLTATFTFTFFQSGRIVGTASGGANDVAPSQTVTVSLVSQDKMFYGRFSYQFQVDAEF